MNFSTYKCCNTKCGGCSNGCLCSVPGAALTCPDRITQDKADTEPADPQPEPFWCEHQDVDESGKVVCLAHLAEGRVFRCQYKTPEDRLRKRFPCSDYRQKVHSSQR